MKRWWVPLAMAGLLGPTSAPAVAAPPLPDRHLFVLDTTDVHGHVMPTTYFRGQSQDGLGVASVYTLVKRYRAQHPDVVLVDSGDLLQGSPLTTYHAKVLHATKGNPMVAAYNRMGYAAFDVGNHDFNYGLPYLEQAMREARFPFVSANVEVAGTTHPFFQPYVIVPVNGLKVGIIGATPPGVAVWDKANVSGKLVFRDIVKSFQRYLPQMKREGADVIVAIPHTGLGGWQGPAYEGYSADTGLPPENVGEELARRCPGLDLILAGHSHQNVPGEVVNGVPIAQADKWGTHLAVADLTLRQVNGHWKVVAGHTTTISTKGVPPAPEVAAAVQPLHEATLAYVNSPLARTPVAWSTRTARTEPSSVLDLIDQVERDTTGADLAAASPFTTSAEIPAGAISEADVAALYPYENTLLAVRIDGKQLKEYLETSARFYLPYSPGQPAFDPKIPAYNFDMVNGVDYRLDVTRPFGDRIRDLTYHGRPVADSDTFTLAVNSYRQRGGGGFTMFKDAPVVYNRGQGIRELLSDYLRRHGEVKPADLRASSWHLVPAGVVGADGRYRAVGAGR